MQKDKMLETLMSLGLTYLQAKSYLTLTQLDRAEARRISKASNVARQDIYRIMPTLEKMGLVEKIVSTPVLYKAIPRKEGFEMLLQKRTTEETMLRKKVKNILNNGNNENSDPIICDEPTEFIIISGKKLLLKRFQTSFQEAVTFDLIFPEFAWNFVIFNLFEGIAIALAKSAKIRILTGQGDIRPSVSRKLEILMKSPFFQIRFACSPIDFGLSIFNDKEVHMCISGNSAEVPSMWTNNPQFVKMAQITFENEWNNAEDCVNDNPKILNSPARKL